MASTITRAPLLQGSVLEEQISLETDAVREGVARYRELAAEAVTRGEGSSLKPAERMLVHWLGPLIPEIRRKQRDCRAGRNGTSNGIIGPVITEIAAPRLAVLAVHEILGQCMAEPGGVKVVKLAYSVGRAVVAEINANDLRLGKPDEFKRLMRKVKKPQPVHYNRWAKMSLEDPVWDRVVCAHLGSYLIWALKEVASADDYGQPFRVAFHHERHRIGHKTVAFIRLDKDVFRLIEDGHTQRQYMRPRYLPMIVPPYPWSKDAQGGYVHIRTPFISKPTATQKKALAEADLSQVWECLNALMATPWRIIQQQLGHVREVFDTGGGELDIPRRDEIPKPEKPADFDTNDAAKKAWKKEASGVHRANIRAKADRMGIISTISVAERMAEYPAFYLPHQLCFRSRAYTIPLHLSHQGDDVRRGMMMFAKPAPLDDRGHFWLRVHACNKFGLDKIPFADRERWTLDHMRHIREAASDPHSEWWKTAKKPWQFRAACIALCDRDIGERLPIDMDGTCNGLQHYTALGRDANAAPMVNMTPADSPNSVYARVAGTTRPLVADDADMGHPIAQRVLELVDTDLVKPVTMTTVYGVTAVGARKQIRERLRKAGLDDAELYEASKYLSAVVLRGIGQVVASAKSIMEWLYAYGQITAGKLGQPARWTTPIGFPVVQPYRRYRTRQIVTILQKVTLAVQDDQVPVKVGKQCDGLAPNFIHSLDATHMFMTARTCAAAGIDFAAVHDCYRFHAAHADRGAAILRQEFVNLHDQPILENLRDEFVARYGTDEFPKPPARGTYDLSQVPISPYFFN